jgi:alkanesulfonate monooxygenase
MPKFALRIDIMARKTEEQAWDEIRRGWEHIDAASPGLGAATNGQVGSDSVGAARSHDLRPKATRDYRELEVAPNVWSGFAHLRPGPAWGLVGSYEQVAQRLDELMDLGADAFILASNPHLEEAYRVGEEVLPLLRGRVTTPDLLAGRQFTTV